MMDLIFKGQNLYLKEIAIHEITDRVINWFNDHELMKYYTSSKDEITKSKLLESINVGKSNGNVFTYGIYTLKSDVLIGTIKLGPINFKHKTSDLVALIGDRDYLGKGYSSEAIKLGNQLAFEKFDLRKLYGGMYVSNVPSIKAYKKAGWLIEGRLKGQYVVNGKSEDRIEVGMFNPKYFSEQELNEIKSNENRFYNT